MWEYAEAVAKRVGNEGSEGQGGVGRGRAETCLLILLIFKLCACVTLLLTFYNRKYFPMFQNSNGTVKSLPSFPHFPTDFSFAKATSPFFPCVLFQRSFACIVFIKINISLKGSKAKQKFAEVCSFHGPIEYI